MTIKKVPKLLLSSVLSTFLLVGFSGKEKYVELDTFLNGRSSAHFRDSDNNLVDGLKKGTQGFIEQRKRFASGNWGYLIRVLDGEKKDKKFWVYHNLSNSDLKLYEELPSKEKAVAGKESKAPEKARAVETVRETPARPAAPEKKATADKPTPTIIRPETAIESIIKSNDSVGTIGTLCTNCLTPKAGAESLIGPATTRRMSQACSSFMNSQGEIGENGQTVFNLMASEKYAKHFTASNSLGSFCPKFNTLNDTQKLQAWTWFWTALAMEESSCNPKLVHGTTYVDRSGKTRILNPAEGYGLWAMERDLNRRAWRGEACNNLSTVYGQARCSIDIMTEQQLKKGRTAKVSSGGYWGPIHRGDKQLMPHMKRMRQCF